MLVKRGCRRNRLNDWQVRIFALSAIWLSLTGVIPERSARGSELPTISLENVGRLLPVLTFRINTPGSYTAKAAAGTGLLYVETPFPHTIFAIDPIRSDQPVRWRFTPPSDPSALGRDCCGIVAGPVLDNGTLFVNTLDGHTIALDAASGHLAWDVQTARPSDGETLTAAPLAVGHRVFVGGGEDEFGARGWIEALDAITGRTLWRRYSTGPDADVGAHSRDLGVSTWPPNGWEHGGGSALGLAYDPGSAQLIHSTGHPAPWNPGQRNGENRWTSGILARDTADGAMRWFLPVNPHDLYALGAGPSNLLIDRDWHGTPRRLLIHPDGNGRVYVVDRNDGALLSAEAFVPTNATTGVDLQSASLARQDSKAISENAVTRDICPGWPGATGPGTAACAQSAGLLYIPVNRMCMDMEARNTTYMSGTSYMGANLRLKAAGDRRGALVAWDVEAAKPVWTAEEHFPVFGGVLATGNGLVFYGTLEGMVKALDGRTGRLLWQHQAPFGIVSTPTLVRGAEGREYLAVLAGLGGPGGVAWRDTDVRDATAAHGYANALRDLPEQTEPGGALLLFALP